MTLNTADTNMLRLIDLLKEAGMIRFKEEFYSAIGVTRQYITGVQNGSRHFTVEHIEKACKTYGIRADWVFGLTSALLINNRIRCN